MTILQFALGAGLLPPPKIWSFLGHLVLSMIISFDRW